MAHPELDAIATELAMDAFKEYLEHNAIDETIEWFRNRMTWIYDDVGLLKDDVMDIIKEKVWDMRRAGEAMINSATRKYLPSASRCDSSASESMFNSAALGPFRHYADTLAVSDALRSYRDMKHQLLQGQVELNKDFVDLVEKKCEDFRHGVEASLDSSMTRYRAFNPRSSPQPRAGRSLTIQNQEPSTSASRLEVAESGSPARDHHPSAPSNGGLDMTQNNVHIHWRPEEERVELELRSPHSMVLVQLSANRMPTQLNWIRESCVTAEENLWTDYEMESEEYRENIGEFHLVSIGQKTIWTRVMGSGQLFPVEFQVTKQNFGNDVLLGGTFQD